MPPRVAVMTTLLLCARTSHADDMDTVRERARVAFAWPAASSLPEVAASARALAASLNASCFWDDVNYADQTRANWGAAVHYERVQVMATALTAPGSPAFEDPALSTPFRCALGAWIFRTPRFSNPNWWYAWIGEEMALQTTFLALGANRTSPAEAARLVDLSYSSAWWTDDWGGGDNLSDMLRIQLMRGLASSNASAVTQGFSTLWADIRVGDVTATPPWEGINVDMSYHFHGIQMLQSAYGAGWIATMLSWHDIGAGTQWSVSAAQQAVLAEFIANGDAQVTFGRQWDYSTQGRGIDRPGMTFAWSLPIASIVSLAAAPAAAPWRDALLAFATRLAGGGAATPLVSATSFWTVDYATVHRATWGASFKGHGDNGLYTVVGNECDNSENILGEHTGNGVLNVFTDDELDAPQRAYANLFPLLDWRMLNGVSAEMVPIEHCGAGDVWPVHNTAFVGAAVLDHTLLVAHDTATHDLTAARAFLFLDAAIVGFGARLVDAQDVDVRTTLAARVLPDPAHDARGRVTAAFNNGSVVELSDGAYSFPPGALAWLNAGGLGVVPDALRVGDGASVGVDVGTRTGSWRTIGPFDGAVSARVFTAWLDHGARVAGASFAYALLPNASAAAMPAAAAGLGGAGCVANSPAVQGGAQVAAGGAPVMGAVFWLPAGGVFACAALNLTLTSSAAGIVLARVNATHATVAVAHPAAAAAGTTLRVGLDRAALGAGCAPRAGGGTTFSLTLPPKGSYMGSSVTVSCALT